MKKAVGVLVCLLALLMCAGAMADVKVNAANFPDANFRQYIREAGFDQDADGKLSDAEIAAVKRIACACREIRSLQGIQHFTALTQLDCGGNALTELDVRQNPALTTLECWGNQLTSLDVSGNPALKELQCDTNQLTSLDVRQNAALTELRCYSNQLTELDVRQNAALTSLSCGGNRLTALDVRLNAALQQLWCDGNQLTALDVSPNPRLHSLGCEQNQLTALDVRQNPALESLTCDSNQLTALDVSQNPALKRLDCARNRLTELDVRQNPALRELQCQHNQLTGLDVSACRAIRKLLRGGDRTDNGTYWVYRGDSDAEDAPLAAFDKCVRVSLGDGETIEPAANPTTATVDGLKYKLSGQTATVTGPKSRNAKTITIPATIRVGDASYRVTGIQAGAFKGMKKLAKVTIGKNVKTIGKAAFQNCGKLKTITIRTKLLTSKSVKSNAFKGIHANATIRCPKGKAKAYAKWLTKKGVPKTVKIKE